MNAIAPHQPWAPPEPSEPEIQRRAYALWQQDGARHGRDLEHWFAARESLRREAVANHLQGDGRKLLRNGEEQRSERRAPAKRAAPRGEDAPAMSHSRWSGATQRVRARRDPSRRSRG